MIKPLHLLTMAIVASSCFMASCAHATACTNYSTQIHDIIMDVMIAKEPEGPMNATIEVYGAHSKECPADANLAYTYLRLAEINEGMWLGDWDKNPNRTRWHQLAAQVAPRFPNDVRIATIRARAEGTLASADAALKLDPAYPPAQVAKAVALLNANRILDAEATIRGVNGLGTVIDGHTVLARILFAKGDMTGAIHAGKIAIAKRKTPPIEDDIDFPPAYYQAQEILGLAYLKQGNYREAAKALTAALPRSLKAETVLKNPEPKLKAALAKLKPGLQGGR